MNGKQGRAAALLEEAKLNRWQLVAIIMSATTPLTVNTAVVPSAYGVTGITALPAAFVIVATVLMLLMHGFLIMSRDVDSPGAFYACIAQVVGKRPGISVALVVLVAYSSLLIGLYGAFGDFVSGLIASVTQSDPPAWWIPALIAVIAIGLLGVGKLFNNSIVLLIILGLDVVCIVVATVANFLNPAPESTVSTVGTAAFWPSVLLSVVTLVLVASLGFVGVEGGALYTLKSKDQIKTVQQSTRVAMLAMAVLYIGGSVGLLIAYGPSKVAALAAEQGPGMVFALAEYNVGPWFGTFYKFMYALGLIAAMGSFQLYVTYYAQVIGSEGVLPAVFGRTSTTPGLTFGAPYAASLTLTGLSLVVVSVAAYFDVAPTETLFFGGGAVGALGILGILTFTAFAVWRHFTPRQAEPQPAPVDLGARPGEHRHHGDGGDREESEARSGSYSWWTRRGAPGTAGICLLGITGVAVWQLDIVLGPKVPAAFHWIIPLAFVGVVIAGLLRGNWLKNNMPAVFDRIGHGGKARTAAVVGQ